LYKIFTSVSASVYSASPAIPFEYGGQVTLEWTPASEGLAVTAEILILLIM